MEEVRAARPILMSDVDAEEQTIANYSFLNEHNNK